MPRPSIESTYKYETETYYFSWTNDKGLIVTRKDFAYDAAYDVVKGREYCDEDDHVIKYMGEIGNIGGTTLVTTAGVKIKNILNMQPNDAYNHMLFNLRDSITTDGREKTQLADGLKYYLLANHYKLLVPQDVAQKKLAALKIDLTNMLEKVVAFEKKVDDYAEQCRLFHISEPLVASTGLAVYSTERCWWAVVETDIKNPEAPEYFHVVQENRYQDGRLKTFEHVGLDSQKNCISQVMEYQEREYGHNLSDLQRLQGERDLLLKSIEELNIIFRVPEKARYEFGRVEAED